MALKVNLTSSSGHTITYVDLYEVHLINVRGKKYITYTMRGWENKAAYIKGYTADYSQTFREELEDSDALLSSLYAKITAGISALSGASAVYDVTAVALDKTEVSLTIGKTATLTATCTPDTAGDLTVTWSSSDTAVATVDSSGTVTAVATGTAVITATSNDEPGVFAACTVTVV